jgi:Cys-tRNA(Pro) deacylase
MISPNLSTSAQRVQEALTAQDIDLQVFELSASTRTAGDAAEAVGCDVGQIAKSLIFRVQDSGNPILIIVSGANRVNLKQAAFVVGESLSKADANFVRNHTGFAIGGVPPVGHISPLRTFIDRDLLQYPKIWAAAGTPNAVFALTPSQLVDLTHGQVITVT